MFHQSIFSGDKSRSNLIDIQSQIEKLQKQATDIKSREFDKTVQDILAKMHAFGITVKDLQPAKRRAAKGKAGAKTAKATGAKRKTAGRKTGQVVAAKYSQTFSQDDEEVRIFRKHILQYLPVSTNHYEVIPAY